MRIQRLLPGRRIMMFFLLSLLLPIGSIPFLRAYQPVTPNADIFYPISDDLRQRVDFWKDIFTQYSPHTAVLHDRMYVNVVYEAVDIAEILGTTKYSSRAKYNVIEKYREKYQKILSELHRRGGDASGLDEEHRRVAFLFEGIPGGNKFLEASQGIRAQMGIRDKFIAGLYRQEKYIKRLREIFREEGIPEEVLALPHVESSFNPAARSRVGAVGMWQFTRSTGRRYLRINNSVDQRLDPYHSTRAAARYLKESYKKLGSWPLAIMSYNHGVAGIMRAKRALNTSDPEEIIRRYSSRSFQFASRNFYPEFLAALETSLTPWAYVPIDELPESFREAYAKYGPQLAMNPQPARNTRQVAALQEKTSEPQAAPDVSENSNKEKMETPVNLPEPAPARNTDDSGEKRAPEGEGLLSKIDNILVADANAMDATREPRLAVNPHASGDYFWIQVYPGESIWNYAEWSGVPLNSLRKVNNISRRGNVRLGMSVNIPKAVAHSTEFERKRREYHKAIEDAYFSKYSVERTIEHKVRYGENLWYICNNKYNIPIWLFQKYNRLNPLKNLQIGDVVIIPVVTEAS